MNSFLFFIAITLSYLSAFLAQTAGKLHTARFARLHEFVRICIAKSDARKNMPAILIGLAPFNRVFAVRPTKKQKELANLVLLGKTRVGKGLNITTNLLTWPFPVIVNDIKREFWDQTAGWRERGLNGRSFMFDPRGLATNSTPSRARQPTRIFALPQRSCFTGRTRGRTPSSPSGPSPC